MTDLATTGRQGGSPGGAAAPTPGGPATTAAHRPSSWAVVRAISATSLRRLARDRLALFMMLALPVLIIIVIGSTIGGGARNLPIGVVDNDGSDTARRFVDAIAADDGAEVKRYDDLTSLERDIRTSTLVAGVEIPPGFGDRLAAGQPAPTTLWIPQAQGGGEAARSIVQSAADQFGARLAATNFVTRQQAAAGRPVDPATAATAVDQAVSRLEPVGVDVRTIGQVQLASDNSFSYTAPANLVLFVFITSLAGGSALVEARQLGITRRSLAAPVRSSSILLGAGTSRFIMALIQAALILVIGALLFKVSWGQPAAVIALVVVYALVGTGAGLLVGSVARNPEQTMAVGIPVAIALGMLGGCMWPLDVVPAPLRAIGHLTPQAWAMDGFVGLIYDGKGLLGIVPELAVLALYAVVLLTIATVLLRRTLTR